MRNSPGRVTPKAGTMTLEELAAREAIRDLIARYNHAGDRGRLVELVRCFAEDGAMDLEGAPPLTGREAIHAHLAGVASRLAANTQRATLRHHVSSVRILLQDGERAEAYSYFCVFTEIGLDHWGRYADRCVRRGDEWLFALRRVRVDGAARTRACGARSPARSRSTAVGATGTSCRSSPSTTCPSHRGAEPPSSSAAAAASTARTASRGTRSAGRAA